MVQQETNLVVADNSGARSVRVFRQYGGSHKKTSTLGDIVLCAVKDAIPNGKVKKSDVVKGVIVDNDGNHGGTRVCGPVARERRDKGYMRIISLAVEVL